MSGKTDYDTATASERQNVAKNAKRNLANSVKDAYDKNPARWRDNIVNRTVLKGSRESIDVIGNRFYHEKGKNYGNAVINNTKYEALSLNRSEMNKLISKNNWAAMTTGSRLKYTSTLHDNFKRLGNQVRTVRGKKGTKDKNVPVYKFYFVPYGTDNVATTVDKKGAAIQANRGKLYAVDADNSAHYKDLGEVYMPFNRTRATSTDGKSNYNEIITEEGSRSSVDESENRVRKVLGIKGTDKGSNTGYYDY